MPQGEQRKFTDGYVLARKPCSGTLQTTKRVPLQGGFLLGMWKEMAGVMVNLWVAEDCEKDWFDRSKYFSSHLKWGRIYCILLSSCTEMVFIGSSPKE